MNESTPVHCADDDDVPLRQYIERILEEREKAVAVAFTALETRLKNLNDLRQEVTHDRGQFQRADIANQRHDEVTGRIHNISEWMAVHRELPMHAQAEKDVDAIYERLKPLEVFRSRAVLIAAGLMAISGVIGASIVRALGG